MWSSLSSNGRGAVWILIAGLCFTAQGAGIKALGESLIFIQIVFIRSIFTAVFVVPVAMRGGGLKTQRLGGHFLRSILGITALSGMVYATMHAPLAEVTTISFTRGLFAVVLSVLILREGVGWRRAAACAVGFVGILVMAQPGFGEFNPALLSALAGASLGACVILTIKHLSRTEAPETIVFYFGLFGLLISAVPAIWVWNWPTATEWLILVALSIAGTVGQALMVRGWSAGEAASMVPFTYAQLPYAAAFGFFLFGEGIDIWTILGAAIIVTSTLYIARREARIRKAALAAEATGTSPA